MCSAARADRIFNNAAVSSSRTVIQNSDGVAGGGACRQCADVVGFGNSQAGAGGDGNGGLGGK